MTSPIPIHDHEDALSGLGLLSLSAAAAEPIAIASSKDNASLPKHSRRLSSSGKSKRRLSDARDAAIRLAVGPNGTPASPSQHLSNLNVSATVSIPVRAGSARIAMSRSAPLESDVHNQYRSNSDISDLHVTPVNRGGRKKSAVYTCESCSKIYRHPSCLIKHRWEHSPQWKEACKFVLSKHQQVQMLEAAAILTHMDTTGEFGTSLPDDRAEWPAFLSGGSLLPPGASHISSSVPARGTFAAGPRMHDYSVSNGSIQQVRPGILAAAELESDAAAAPVSVPRRGRGASNAPSHPPSSFSYRSAQLHTRSYSSDSRWSQPPSSLRSMSRSSPSEEEEEEDLVDDHANLRVESKATRIIEQDDDDAMSVGETMVKTEDDWDGIELEMEME